MLSDVVVNPFIEFETIEGDALFTDGDFGEAWPNLGIEAIAVHAEVGRCVPQPQNARQQGYVACVAGFHASATYITG